MGKRSSLSTALLCVLIIIPLPIIIKGAKYCPLKWDLLRYENATKQLPPSALVINEGNSQVGKEEFIGRIYRNSKWVIGRVPFYADGSIHIPEGNAEYISGSYQVLTNPHKCTVGWEYAESGSVPEFTVSNYPEDGMWSLAEYYIGRTDVSVENSTEGVTLGGYIDPTQRGIVIAYENKAQIYKGYAALTSVYPKLTVDLNDFVFDVGPVDFEALEESGTRMELIGQDNIIYQLDSGSSSSFSQMVRHVKTVQEVFEIEDDLNWAELAAVKKVRVALWFGGEDVLSEDHGMKSGSQSAIRIERDREVRIERDFVVPNSGVNIQICSIAMFLDGEKIPFRATGTFYHDVVDEQSRLEPNQVAQAVLSSGRSKVVVKGDRVVAEVKGMLSGRFFLRTLSHISHLDPSLRKPGSCLGLYTQWARAQG